MPFVVEFKTGELLSQTAGRSQQRGQKLCASHLSALVVPQVKDKIGHSLLFEPLEYLQHLFQIGCVAVVYACLEFIIYQITGFPSVLLDDLVKEEGIVLHGDGSRKCKFCRFIVPNQFTGLLVGRKGGNREYRSIPVFQKAGIFTADIVSVDFCDKVAPLQSDCGSRRLGQHLQHACHLSGTSRRVVGQYEIETVSYGLNGVAELYLRASIRLRGYFYIRIFVL